MQPKFTPGPWTLVHDEPYEIAIEVNGQKVPGVDVWLDDACHDLNNERKANARLISAAPEMREALRLLLADFEAIGAEPWHLEEARAALRKADGDAP